MRKINRKRNEDQAFSLVEFFLLSFVFLSFFLSFSFFFLWFLLGPSRRWVFSEGVLIC